MTMSSVPLSKHLAGPLTGFGILVAAVIALADQVTKVVILLMFGMGLEFSLRKLSA